MEGANDYPSRTKKNVDDANVTIVFRFHSSPGTDKTIGYAQTGTWCSRSSTLEDGYRPVLVIKSFSNNDVKLIPEFLLRHSARVVNIAGHRQSSSGILNFDQHVKVILSQAFGDYMFLCDMQ